MDEKVDDLTAVIGTGKKNEIILEVSDDPKCP